MATYTITLTQAEEKALQSVASSPQDWMDHAVKERCRQAMDDIVQSETKRMINEGIPISGTREDVVMRAVLPSSDLVSTIPTSVTMRQALSALAIMGDQQTPPVDYIAQVNATIDSMPGAEGKLARIDFEKASTVRKDYPLLEAVRTNLGWTEAQRDEFMIFAATL